MFINIVYTFTELLKTNLMNKRTILLICALLIFGTLSAQDLIIWQREWLAWIAGMCRACIWLEMANS